MVFSSLLFLFLFLPAVLLLYYGSPKRLRNLVLFLTSLVFYAWGEPVYIVLMLLATISDFTFGLLLSKPSWRPGRRKLVVASSIAINVGLLGFFKYADYLIENANAALGTSIPAADLPLPIGISFYTFQSISYVVDIYRGTAKAQRNWIDFGAFVALFPQLVAGPIVQYGSIAEQLKNRRVDLALFALGIRRFLTGLAKKVLLGSNIGLLWDTISAQPPDSLPAATAWLGIVAFALHVYFDFSGYSDMAIGLGHLFGFRFDENFDKPYAAQSITDFWRRWHISLGRWFRDYVYIPLGGNRRGPWKQLRNIAVVWLLTGIWHGASWNFLLWGAYFGVVLILEKWWMLRLLAKAPRWTRHAYALLLILIGWVLFAFERLPEMGGYFLAMAGLNGRPFANGETLYLLHANALLLVLLVVASVRGARAPKAKALVLLEPIWYAALFVASTAYLVDATFNPFIYFRF